MDDYNHERSNRFGNAENNMRGFGGRNQSDPEMGGIKRPFNREDFRNLINKTYNEYYGKFRDQFCPEEYMQCVDNEQML